jgi:hypothetical protein
LCDQSDDIITFEHANTDDELALGNIRLAAAESVLVELGLTA